MKVNTNMARTAFRYCGGMAALFILLTNKLEAQTRIDEKPVMQVTYQQEESDFLVFKVSILNAGSKKTLLKITDSNNGLLYSESVLADTYIKTVKIPKYETNELEFRITNAKETIRKSFDVRLKTKETLEVVELDL
jgi:hypothetical protein